MDIKEIGIGDTLMYLDYSMEAPVPKRDIGTIYQYDPQWVRCRVVKKFRNLVTVVTEYGREFRDRASEFSYKVEGN